MRDNVALVPLSDDKDCNCTCKKLETVLQYFVHGAALKRSRLSFSRSSSKPLPAWTAWRRKNSDNCFTHTRK